MPASTTGPGRPMDETTPIEPIESRQPILPVQPTQSDRPLQPGTTVPIDRVPADEEAGPESRAHPPAPQWPPSDPAARTLARRSSGPRRSNRRPWLIAGLGATLLLAGTAGTGTWSLFGHGGISNTLTQEQVYERPVQALTFSGGSSDVRVLGGAAPGTIEVTRHLSWGPGGSQPQPDETWSGTTLEISSDCDGSFLAWCSIDYDLRVPDTTNVSIDVGSGDISVGGPLDAVSMETGSGDIDAGSLESQNLVAKTGSGNIDLDLVSPPSSATLRTGSGDVDVQLPRGVSYAVDVHTGSGDQEIDIPTDPGSAHKIAAETGSGDVTLSSG